MWARQGKPGWAVASQARYLVYLVTEPETIYFIAMQRVRSALPAVERRCVCGSAHRMMDTRRWVAGAAG